MRRRILSVLVFCCILPAQTKKVIANLSPDMLKELAVSAPNVRIVATRGVDLAKEIEDADAMVGVTVDTRAVQARQAAEVASHHQRGRGIPWAARPDSFRNWWRATWW